MEVFCLFYGKRKSSGHIFLPHVSPGIIDTVKNEELTYALNNPRPSCNAIKNILPTFLCSPALQHSSIGADLDTANKLPPKSTKYKK